MENNRIANGGWEVVWRINTCQYSWEGDKATSDWKGRKKDIENKEIELERW